MASNDITVIKQNVTSYLKSGIEKPFVIPEYQRPYAWTIDQIDTLVDDLWNFALKDGGANRNGAFFLGCIVSYDNPDNENGTTQDIIDGQQRITSFYILLRAMYDYLRNSEETKVTKKFMREIEPVVWSTDNLTGDVDFNKIHITSHVISETDNKVLSDILSCGKVTENAKDNYSKNYLRFKMLIEDKAREDALMINDFFYAIINQAIIVPISAGSQDTALDIFTTLNDRGLILSDADIFKAKIYNDLSEEDKVTFIDSWKELDELSADVDETIQKLFTYYFYYLRASEDKNSDTTLPSIRKYYSENRFCRLLKKDLMQQLKYICNLLSVVRKNQPIIAEEWQKDKQIMKYLDILVNTSINEYWKYPVVIYYLHHHNSIDFAKHFKVYLGKLLSELLKRQLFEPGINFLKQDMLKHHIAICESISPRFDFKEVRKDVIEDNIATVSGKIVRIILKIIAYEKQDDIMPVKWDIEHILPQKYKTGYYNIYESEEKIKETIEHIGNKLPFEKRLNIIAGNGYFDTKKSCYIKSKFAITREMGESKLSDWSLKEIEERDKYIRNFIMAKVEEWDREYSK